MTLQHGLNSNPITANSYDGIYKDDLISKLTNALHNEQFVDVSFKFVNEHNNNDSGNVVLKANKFMLSLNSPVFATMFTAPFKESSQSLEKPISITGIQPDVFKSMLQFMYSGKFSGAEMSLQHVFELLVAADFYGILKLQEACSNEMKKRISIENVIGLFQNLQNKLISPDLTDGAKTFIQKNFEDLLQSKEFVKFTNDNLCLLLADPETCIENEICLFRSLIKWSHAECVKNKLEATPLNKRNVLGNITNFIQFSKMKPEDISRDVCESKILNADELLLILRHISVSPPNQSALPQLPFTLVNRKRKPDNAHGSLIKCQRCHVRRCKGGYFNLCRLCMDEEDPYFKIYDRN